MFKRLLAATLAVFATPLPALAHVKWFLAKSEAQLLALPKPELFTRLSAGNLSVAILALLLFFGASVANQRLATWSFNQKLNGLFVKAEPAINMVMGIFTGVLLLKCAGDMTFFVPSLHLHHCCAWIARTEAVIGLALCLGFLTRPAAGGMLLLLLFGLLKFSLADCADLLPMYGIAAYFIIVGRGQYSVDRLLGLSAPCDLAVSEFAYTMLRYLLGCGLAYLGLDEKLINPQLALDLLGRLPALNFAHAFGMSNEVFVLCSGATEVVLGLMLLRGVFPRFVVIALTLLFAATTGIFGSTELFGHMPYYGIMAAIFLRGGQTFSLTLVQARLYQLVRPLLEQPVRALP